MPSDILEQLGLFKDEFSGKMGELFAAVNKANEQVLLSGKASDETRAELKALSDKVQAMQQANARFTPAGAEPSGSIGRRFIESAEMSALAGLRRGRARVDFKNVITTANVNSTPTVGQVVPRDRQEGIIPLPRQNVFIRPLLSQGNTASNMIEYVREHSFTNNAAPVAEGALKPESSLDFAVETAPIRTIAHWMLATKQILDDMPQLESLINDRLLYGLRLVEDQQLLFGDGTGENLTGIATVARDFDTTLFASLGVAAPQKVDVLRAAILQVVNTSMLAADGIVLNPVDSASIELLKNGDGNYLYLNADGRIWRLPVVESPSMPQGEFLVGAFRMAATVFDRQEAVVEVSTEDNDNFRKNLVTIRAENREGIAIYRPDALVRGDFDVLSPEEPEVS
jgi:HK97 family phage major capsid protein